METRMVARIDQTECDRSPFCPAARGCPTGAIGVQVKGALPSLRNPLMVDEEKCTGCGRCARICPHGAISMVRWGQSGPAAGAAGGRN